MPSSPSAASPTASWDTSSRHYLQALCSRGDTADIVDALLALHEERQRRDNERMQQRNAQEREEV
jgi:hypothetical protein